MSTLAVKYRPKKWEDVCGQNSIKIILQNQLDTNEFKHAYLFCGGAGTGKTTCARIFANEINHGQGNAIEIDAASNSGVDDVRSIIENAKHSSINSKYKIFIIDECHSISNAGWQAFLKLLEEPPETAIFIFCTTDPQKIPKTILSRTQRYDFQRISTSIISDRLYKIAKSENLNSYDAEGIEYIAKIADGGMRDAITMLEQCISYSDNVTVENVLSALGLESTSQMISLTNYLLDNDVQGMISVIEKVHSAGHDLKQFISSYLQFLINVKKAQTNCPLEFVQLPITQELLDWIDEIVDVYNLIHITLKINSAIKWETNTKTLIETMFLDYMLRRE